MLTKKRAIFSYLKAQINQETCSSVEGEKVWSAEWGGKIFFSHGSFTLERPLHPLNPSSTLLSVCEALGGLRRKILNSKSYNR